MNEQVKEHLKCINEILQAEQKPFLFLTKEGENIVSVKNLTERGAAMLMYEYMNASGDVGECFTEVCESVVNDISKVD